MRRPLPLSAILLALGVTHAVAAQTTIRTIPANGAIRFERADQSRALLGVTTTSGASARDTLGLLVASVTTGGPADKAGIEEGTRIVAINDVSLRLSAADVGDSELGDLMSHRLTRELEKTTPGAEVGLRLYAAGQTRTVKVKIAESATSSAPNNAWKVLDGNGELLVKSALDSRARSFHGSSRC